MNNDVEVMLYVKDVAKEVEFWQTLGFVERSRQDMGDNTMMVQVAPSEEATFALNLFDIEFIKVHSPEVANNVPSIMFYSDDIEGLYAKAQAAGIETGELVQLGWQKVFNFANPDGLYFAVSGI